jgi:hypothetical protein
MALERKLIPPKLRVIALVMVLAEFAPFRILLPLSAGLDPWQAAQLDA